MGSYLGQNFLIDSKVKFFIGDKIRDLYTKGNCDCLIEIGPGKGALTQKIISISDNFFVIEKDIKMVDYLTKKIEIDENFQKGLNKKNIINEDVISFDLEKFINKKNINITKTLIVGNLPYYITSPILRKFFGYGKKKFFGGIFLVQHEVAERIKSDTKKKSYLWWVLNYSYDVKYLKGVSAKAFKPVPKVKSAVIQLDKNKFNFKFCFDDLISFLDIYSGFARKMLGKIQKIQEKKIGKIEFQIPTNLKKKRLEELNWEDIGIIFNV